MKRVRRMSKKIIPLSFSETELSQLKESKSITKSKSEPFLLLDTEIEIEFEGDGPLGIVWTNIENEAYVKQINLGTVAGEEYDLKVGYKLLKIEDYNCIHISYSDIMNLIRLKWQKFGRIKMKFEINELPPKKEEQVKIDCPIYIFLKKHNAEEFYKDFITLGAKDLSDLEFIEYQDLINMKMNTEKRKRIYKEIKQNESKINVYFNPYLSEEQIMKEKQKYNGKDCNFIEIRHNHSTNVPVDQ